MSAPKRPRARLTDKGGAKETERGFGLAEEAPPLFLPRGGWRSTEAARGLSAFRRGVYELLCAVPAGRVTTYSHIGTVLGAPSGQAVGTAMRQNPWAPEVPCHRVISGGPHPSLGGFNGSLESSEDDNIRRKRAILQAEGVAFDTKNRLVDASRLFLPCHWPKAYRDFFMSSDPVEGKRNSGAASPGARSTALEMETLSPATSGAKKRR